MSHREITSTKEETHLIIRGQEVNAVHGGGRVAQLLDEVRFVGFGVGVDESGRCKRERKQLCPLVCKQHGLCCGEKVEKKGSSTGGRNSGRKVNE